MEDNQFNDNIHLSIDALCTYIEKNGLNGTSVTTPIGEVNIKGKTYQIQIRLESKDILEMFEIIESQLLSFDTEKSILNN